MFFLFVFFFPVTCGKKARGGEGVVLKWIETTNYQGWSTYPHVRYPHEISSLNKALLREQPWLTTPS